MLLATHDKARQTNKKSARCTVFENEASVAECTTWSGKVLGTLVGLWDPFKPL